MTLPPRLLVLSYLSGIHVRVISSLSWAPALRLCFQTQSKEVLQEKVNYFLLICLLFKFECAALNGRELGTQSWLGLVKSAQFLDFGWADRKAFVFIALDTNHFYFLPPSNQISLIILKPIFSTLYISHRVKYSQCCGLFLCSANTQLWYVTISSQESLVWRSLSAFCYHCVFSLPLTPVQGFCKLRTRFLLNSCSHGPTGLWWAAFLTVFLRLSVSQDLCVGSCLGVSVCDNAQHVPSTCPNTQLCDRFSELVGEYFVFQKYPAHPWLLLISSLPRWICKLQAGLSVDLHFLRVSHPDTMWHVISILYLAVSTKLVCLEAHVRALFLLLYAISWRLDHMPIHYQWPESFLLIMCSCDNDAREIHSRVLLWTHTGHVTGSLE